MFGRRHHTYRPSRRLSLFVNLVVVILVVLLSPAAPASASNSTAVSAGRPSPVFVPPVSGALRVLTPFRPPVSKYGPGHRGADLALPPGGQVVAAADGTIVFAGPLAGRGVISIDHPMGVRTTYEPVTATVRPGDRVVAGQPIGSLQSGHPSCAPASCLHWGARLPDGSYLDPMRLLTGLKVRLLPWPR